MTTAPEDRTSSQPSLAAAPLSLPQAPLRSVERRPRITRSLCMPRLWDIIPLASSAVGVCLHLGLWGLDRKYETRLEWYAHRDDAEIGEWRRAQQEEWDRLSFTLTLLATVSAAALAFTDINTSFWLSRALFSAALGLSLCGVLVVHYIGVLAVGVSDTVMKTALQNTVQSRFAGRRHLAKMMAAPAVFGAWCTILVLIGLIVFTWAPNKPQETVRAVPTRAYRAVVYVPIAIGLYMVGFTVLTAEVMWRRRDMKIPGSV